LRKELQGETFVENTRAFDEYINSLFENFELELNVYDEVEYFKPYNNPGFNYPY
jgi:hypothetical protein